MSDINKFTTKEVLNKVLLDSSGNAVTAFSHTTQEAFNAVLDTTNNRLNVSLAGGTLSGDVTISGDLTVNGNGSGNYDEIVNGNLVLSSGSKLGIGIGDADPASSLEIKGSTNTLSKITLTNTNPDPDNIWSIHANYNTQELKFNGDSTTVLTLLDTGTATFSGDVGIGTTSPQDAVHIKTTADADIGLQVQNDDTQAFCKVQSGGSALYGGNNKVTLVSGGSYTTAMVIDTAQKVGIGSGATTPSHPLHVATGNDNGLIAEFQNTEDTDDRCFGVRIKAGSTSTDYALQVQDHDASNTLFRVSGNGHTGVGTNSPARLFHVSGVGSGNALAVIEDTSSNANLLIKATVANKNSILLFGDADNDEVGRIDYEHNGDEMHFYTGSTVRLKLDANSRISLGNNDASGTIRNTIFGHQTGNVLASGALENTLFGYQAGLALDTGDYNTAFGCLALKTEELGQGSVAIGGSSLFSQNRGSESLSHNVAVGLNTSYYNVTGQYNTAIGSNAMLGASGNSHSNNTAIGYAALLSTTTADGNVAIGSMAGKDITEGKENVFIGQSAGENAVGNTHIDNVIIGFEAGKNLANQKNTVIGHKAYTNGQGNSNLAIGHLCMGSGTVSGYSNQAIGRQAMENLAGGQQNIAIGEQALQENQNGHEQIGIGNQALRDCNGGVQNIAIGFQSQRDHNAGDYNTSVGWKTLQSDTGNGNDNTAFGAGVLQNFVADTNAHGQNTAIGSYSCNSNVTGKYNTALGAYTLQYATSGNHNVMLGYTAGKFDDGENNVTSPDECVVIGSLAEPDTATPTNEIVIGYGTHGTGDNEIAFGNTSISAIKAQVTSITAYSSDERTKKDVADYDLKGVDFIKELNLKTYVYKNPVDYPSEIRSAKWDRKDEDGNLMYKKPKDPTEIQVGLIAQEVQSALAKHGVKNPETYAPTQNNGIKTLTYGNLIFPLIKAVQELSARVEELEKK